ncbi:MAG: glucuronyl hydrolase [Flavobacteriaceae bacterium]|nr:MAG: glucuronyl hydrolase [Flavobacteriaceae bacterium]
MKQNNILFLTILSILLFSSCKHTENNIITNDLITVIESQYELLFESIQSEKNTKKFLPRNNIKGEIGYIPTYDWTSGFYPGSLWEIYNLTKNEIWKKRALDYTERMESVKFFTNNHDIGFMIGCSFGNAIKTLKTTKYDAIIVQAATSLASRYRAKIGVIQSWNKGSKWSCPVIIDNMMNLELLFHATRISGDSTYYNIAIRHANNTLKNHFREDSSSYHVLDYDLESGAIVARNTHQGYADESAWARGQSWGLYGFTVMYRETKDTRYLEQAVKIANFIKNHPNLPEDQIPYWDFNVKAEKDTPRDASAAAITASALLELCTYVDEDSNKIYKDWAIEIIRALSSKAYLAEKGTNNGFLLKHSVGSLPHNSEINAAINYADYYYLEALNRLKI